MPEMVQVDPEDEARYDENLMTAELKAFIELVEKKGSNMKAEDLQRERLKVGFQRAANGRVSIRSKDGQWFTVKPDMQVSGYLLLRDEADGRTYYLPPEESGRLMQVDLSDDLVVSMLFGTGAWSDVMSALQVQENGQAVPYTMSAFQFRDALSLLEGASDGSAPAP